jgi:hypothetical protein
VEREKERENARGRVCGRIRGKPNRKEKGRGTLEKINKKTKAEGQGGIGRNIGREEH